MTGSSQRTDDFATLLRWALYLGFGVLCCVPLFFNREFFFPFITTKALAFRVTVEIMFVLYLLLAWREPAARIKPRMTLVLFGLFVGGMLISAALGANPFKSFWGNLERSEGVITWLHLLALLVIASGTLRKIQEWYHLFDGFIIASLGVSLIGLGQITNSAVVQNFLPNTTGERVSSTIGSAAYLPSYLLFVIGFCALLMGIRRNMWTRLGYAAVILGNVYIIFETGTRGAELALVVALFLASVAAFVFSKIRWLQYTLVGSLVAVLLFGGVVYANRTAPWVLNSPSLSRIASISLDDFSLQTRFWTWASAMQGWVETPKTFLVGYGSENFSIPFDKYFNPKIMRNAGSIVWFDRAHNVFIDRAVMGGLVGLLLYVALLLYPVQRLWRRYRATPEQLYVTCALTILMIAYAVQNILLFDTIVSYIPWILLLGFVAYITNDGAPEVHTSRLLQWWDAFVVWLHRERAVSAQKTTGVVYGVSAVVAAVAVIALVNPLHVQPTRAGIEVISSLHSPTPDEDPLYSPVSAVDTVLYAIDRGTYANQEFRIQLATIVGALVRNKNITQDQAKIIVDRVDQELSKQIAENPTATNYLLTSRHWYDTRGLRDPEVYAQQSTAYLEAAQALSPTRPEVYFEVGYRALALAELDRAQGRNEQAVAHVATAEKAFRRAIELNPLVAESFINLLSLHLKTGDDAAVQRVWDEAMLRSPNFAKQSRYLAQFADNAGRNKRYAWAAKAYEILVARTPNDVELLIRLALADAYLQKNNEAIRLAERVKQLSPVSAGDADAFIAKVKAGEFKTTTDTPQ